MVLSTCLITGCSKKKNQPNNVDNQGNNHIVQDDIKKPNDSIKKIQTIGTIKFEIKNLKSENNISTLEYSIINESSGEVVIPKYKMTISNDKNIIYTLNISHKNNILNPNQTRLIKKKINHDLTKATSITFELIEE